MEVSKECRKGQFDKSERLSLLLEILNGNDTFSEEITCPSESDSRLRFGCLAALLSIFPGQAVVYDKKAGSYLSIEIKDLRPFGEGFEIECAGKSTVAKCKIRADGSIYEVASLPPYFDISSSHGQVPYVYSHYDIGGRCTHFSSESHTSESFNEGDIDLSVFAITRIEEVDFLLSRFKEP